AFGEAKELEHVRERMRIQVEAVQMKDHVRASARVIGGRYDERHLAGVARESADAGQPGPGRGRVALKTLPAQTYTGPREQHWPGRRVPRFSGKRRRGREQARDEK